MIISKKNLSTNHTHEYDYILLKKRICSWDLYFNINENQSKMVVYILTTA